MHCYKWSVLTVTSGLLSRTFGLQKSKHYFEVGVLVLTFYIIFYFFYYIYFLQILIKKECVELGLADGFDKH